MVVFGQGAEAVFEFLCQGFDLHQGAQVSQAAVQAQAGIPVRNITGGDVDRQGQVDIDRGGQGGVGKTAPAVGR